MSLEIDLVADSVIKGRIYPAMSTHRARPYTQSWREFDRHYPYTTPLRLQEYSQYHGLTVNIHPVHNFPHGSFYPICLSFFDFGIDYLALLPQAVMLGLRQKTLKLLFMYHEGDNPNTIKQRLDQLCIAHKLTQNCYVFVSANSAADRLHGFVTFHDFELWYFHRNLPSDPASIAQSMRQYDFTVLCRLHKSWRLIAMTDLWRKGVLEDSLWSYCQTTANNNTNDSAIVIDSDVQWQQYLEQFVQKLPHYADNLDQDQRNDHSLTDYNYFQNSWCHIVIESQFDVDGSNGVFLTEKTFKPIKHGQMFFVAGAQGSLQVLRDLGYEVFDNILDTSYDCIANATERWNTLVRAIAAAKPRLAHLHQKALPAIQHNQQLFMSNKIQRLNTLIEKIHNAHC